MDDYTVIFTSSTDVTTDIVMNYLPPNQVFRFNFDLFSLYDIVWTPRSLQITDPIGRSINFANVKKAYFRKPVLRKGLPSEEAFAENEKWAAFQSIVCAFWEHQKLVLVEPFSEKTWINKFRQLRIAQDYFQTPDTFFTTKIEQHLPNWEQSVVKNFTGGLMGNRTIYTTLINPQQLSPDYAWFLQEYISANYDLTIVFVRGQLFSFQLERDFLQETVDFRVPSESWKKWNLVKMPDQFEENIRIYMARLQLDYGRLDFLLDSAGVVTFCEVNSNGQFAWLDLDNKTGLIQCIADEVSPLTSIHPLPHYPFIS